MEKITLRMGGQFAIARLVVAVAVAGLVGASCGTGVEASQAAGEETEFPATTLAVSPGTGDTPIASISAAAVTEPCPNSNQTGGSGGDPATEVTRLEPMLGRVVAYGAEHADVFGSYGLVWDGGDASVFVSFTGEIETHRQALEELVEFPDELIVCQVAVAGDVALALQAQLINELRGRFISMGIAGAGLQVTLAANEATLAEELQTRYGDTIELKVGALVYPIDQAESVCVGPPTARDLPGLGIYIAKPAAAISATGTAPANLTVTLTNESESPIRFNSGAALGTILDTNGQVVNSNTFELGGVGVSVDLAPGERTNLPLLVSTASCAPDMGYMLPAGEYQLVANVQYADGEATMLTSNPTLIKIAG